MFCIALCVFIQSNYSVCVPFLSSPIFIHVLSLPIVSHVSHVSIIIFSWGAVESISISISFSWHCTSGGDGPVGSWRSRKGMYWCRGVLLYEASRWSSCFDLGLWRRLLNVFVFLNRTIERVVGLYCDFAGCLRMRCRYGNSLEVWPILL